MTTRVPRNQGWSCVSVLLIVGYCVLHVFNSRCDELRLRNGVVFEIYEKFYFSMLIKCQAAIPQPALAREA